jgi:hypothetical protein
VRLARAGRNRFPEAGAHYRPVGLAITRATSTRANSTRPVHSKARFAYVCALSPLNLPLPQPRKAPPNRLPVRPRAASSPESWTGPSVFPLAVPSFSLALSLSLSLAPFLLLLLLVFFSAVFLFFFLISAARGARCPTGPP